MKSEKIPGQNSGLCYTLIKVEITCLTLLILFCSKIAFDQLSKTTPTAQSASTTSSSNEGVSGDSGPSAMDCSEDLDSDDLEDLVCTFRFRISAIPPLSTLHFLVISDVSICLVCKVNGIETLF